MKIFRMKRGEGKTSRLIEESANSGVPIFAINDHRRHVLMEKANVMGYKIPSPVTFEDLSTATNVHFDRIIVDDAEYTLPAILNYFLCITIAAEAFSTNTLEDRLIDFRTILCDNIYRKSRKDI